VSLENNFGSLSSPTRGREFFISGEALWQWRQTARQSAIAAQVPPAELDWLLQTLGDVDRLALRLESFKARSQIPFKLPLTELQHLWQQRLQERVPVQYLAGVAPWRQFWLTVSPAVLIPRPETEVLIELAEAAVQGTTLASSHWADLGTGSGAIAIGLATSFPTATIHAVDVSSAALAIAQINAQRYQVSDRIQFTQGTWFEPLPHLQGTLSGIVSNPPYIPSTLLPDLQPEVTRHEPHLALDGGEDGLNAVRHLVTTAPTYLRPGAVWLVELMAGQAIAVADLLRQQGCYESIEIYPDLAGIDRFVLARRSA
jgi:release factor glutamine methyltransferase